jgi:hypothetical protein
MGESRGIPCVVYAAKSTQDTRGSIPDQIKECSEAIDADPLRELVTDYKDEAVSGYRKDRGQGLADAIEHCEDLATQHGICELWVQHSDRLARGDGRTARHTVEIALWALKADVRVRTIQDPDTFRDLLYAVVTGQRNNEDSRRKALSSQSGRRRAIARGQPMGQPPDGYLCLRHLDSGGRVERELVVDPDREALLELIFRLALRGRSCSQIARAVNKRGWLTKPGKRGLVPKPFEETRIRYILRNPSYAGLGAYKGEVLARDCWSGYITERQHERLCKAHPKAPPGTGRKRTRRRFLLAGLACCGECGRKLYVVSGITRLDGTRRRSYVCASRLQGAGIAHCANLAMDAHVIEAMLITSLPALLDREPNLPTSQGRYARIAGRALQSQRVLRERTDIDRISEWAEQQTERTPTDGDEIEQHAGTLDRWFTTIAIRAIGETIEISATRCSADLTVEPVTVMIDRRAWARQAPGPGSMGWGKIEIIGALEAWASEHGRSPTWADWLPRTPERPHPWTVRRKFVTWNRALAAAGLARVPGNQPRPSHFAKHDGVTALQTWARKHGRAPRSMEWAHAAPEHPTAATIREHFGTWQDALNAAGLEPTRRPARRSKPWLDEDILQALRDWTSEHGHPPIAHNWVRARPTTPSVGTVLNHYGTWAKALTAAGLPANGERSKLPNLSCRADLFSERPLPSIRRSQPAARARPAARRTR